MTLPPLIGRHGFDLDCEPCRIANRARWLKRWNCSCGAKGHWYPHLENEVYGEWREHAEAMTRLAGATVTARPAPPYSAPRSAPRGVDRPPSRRPAAPPTSTAGDGADLPVPG